MSIVQDCRVAAVCGLLSLALAVPSNAQCPPFFEPGAGFTGFRIGQGSAASGSLSVRGCLWDPDGDGPREPALVVVAPGHAPYSYEHLLNDLYVWNATSWEPFTAGVYVYGGSSGQTNAQVVNHRGDLILAANGMSEPGVGTNNVVLRHTSEGWKPVGHTTGWRNLFAYLSATGEQLYAVGDHLEDHNRVRRNVLRLEGDQWLAFADGWWDFRWSIPSAIQSWNGGVYVGGSRHPGDPNAAFTLTVTTDSGTAPLVGLNGRVDHLACWNDELLAVGAFTTAGGLPVNGLASWDGASWHGLGFPLADAAFAAIGVVGDQLIVLAAAGSGASEFAEIWTLDAEGWACESKHVRAPVGFGYDILGLNGDPTILGTLFHVDGSFVAGTITRRDGVWRAFENGTDRPVRDIAKADIGDFVVGYFRQIEGVVANCVARRSGSTWQPLPPLTDVNGNLTAATAHGGALVVGGNYLSPRGTAFSHAAMWTGDEWQPLGDGPPLTDIRALTSDGDTLYAGGKGGVASFASDVWSPIGSPIVSTLTAPIRAMAMHGGHLVAAGRFTKIANLTTNSIARWNGSTWQAMGTGLDGTVYSLCEHDGNLIAAGSFVIPGYTERNLARWTGAAWEPLEGGTDATVVTVRSLGGSLFVHGGFSRAGDSIIPGTALFNGRAWRPLPMESPHPLGLIYDVESVTGRWLAVGDFSALNDLPQAYLSRFALPCEADYHCDGVVDVIDLISFLDDFVLCQRPPRMLNPQAAPLLRPVAAHPSARLSATSSRTASGTTRSSHAAPTAIPTATPTASPM
jgi:hypothetical protein